MINGQDVKNCLNYLPQITGDLHFSWLNIRYKTLVNRFLFKISRYSICRWQTPPTKKANCVYILTLTTCWEMFAYVSDYTICQRLQTGKPCCNHKLRSFRSLLKQHESVSQKCSGSWFMYTIFGVSWPFSNFNACAVHSADVISKTICCVLGNYCNIMVWKWAMKLPFSLALATTPVLPRLQLRVASLAS